VPWWVITGDCYEVVDLGVALRTVAFEINANCYVEL
jgi:hypothetical protein